MKILALETSAGPASCAVVEDGVVLASSYNHTANTHSQTLMPMIEGMLKQASLSLDNMDLLAVSAGPGSFTGVRIGAAAVKGMAFPANKPCAGVSTLAAIARGAEGVGFNGVVCAAMDARCRQVYTACFAVGDEGLSRLTPDEAISTEELKQRLQRLGKPIMFMGDGAALCYAECKYTVPQVQLAPEHLRFQHAVGVAAEAWEYAKNGEVVNAEALQPLYLRLPQAERELRERTQKSGK